MITQPNPSGIAGEGHGGLAGVGLAGRFSPTLRLGAGSHLASPRSLLVTHRIALAHDG